MNAEFYAALDLLEKEKGIPQSYMFEKVEAAITAAYKREFGGETNVRVVFNADKKDMRVYQVRTVVETVENPITEISLEEAQRISRRNKIGSEVEIKMDPTTFRRLSAQSAKQVLIQAIREAERTVIAREYENRRSEVLTATVDKVDESNGCLVLDTGTSRAVLPKSEQIPGETYHVGDRLKVYVSEVHGAESRGSIVSLSRIHPDLIRRLFELEIPEIQDGTVIIKSVARDPGSRSKIAVYSKDENVDPVGACIGNKGMRIANVLSELGNEKIDVIRYSEDPARFVAEALSPATVLDVEIDGDRTCRVTVAPDQLSLAIGKEGQNVKLAVKLTGYKIDIKA